MTDSQERLRHRLDVQSMQIESFFDRRQVSGEVNHGAVRGAWIDFDLRGQLEQGVERVRDWATDLAEYLGVPEIRLERQNGGLRVAVRRGPANPADLLNILATCGDLPMASAVLGRDDQGQALLLTLDDPEIGHILVAGRTGAGRTSLLRAMALSLALSSRQSQLQLGLIDVDEPAELPGKRDRLLPLAYLPHLMFPLADRIGEAVDALNFLAAEVEYRLDEGLDQPVMVVMIDNADDLILRGGEAVRRPLQSLLANGGPAGLRVILSARDATAKSLRDLLRANVTVRLVGAVADAAQARAASGVLDSYAEYQQGPGEFLAVTHGSVIPFMAAFADHYDAHLALKRLYRANAPVLLAKRPPAPPDRGEGEATRYFQRDNGRTVLHDKPVQPDYDVRIIEQGPEGEQDSEPGSAPVHDKPLPGRGVVDAPPAEKPKRLEPAPEATEDWVYEDIEEQDGWPPDAAWDEDSRPLLGAEEE